MSDRLSRLATPVATVLFVGLTLAWIFIGSSNTPDSNWSGPRVIAFYVAHHHDQSISDVLGAVGFMFFFFLAALLRGYPRRVERARIDVNREQRGAPFGEQAREDTDRAADLERGFKPAAGECGECGADLAVLADRLEGAADGVEFVADLVGEAPHAGDRGEGNESGDERILDEVLPGIVGQQALQPTL